MGKFDTSLGGLQQGFPQTDPGLLKFLEAPGDPKACVEFLCRNYWKPVYAYVRAAWSKSNEDAKDLTQAFFAWLFEEDQIRQYRPEQGAFRPYLKVLLRRFVGHQERALRSLKRGGDRPVRSLEHALGDLGDLPSRPGEGDPEEMFRRVCRTELVHEAIERVRNRCAREGETLAFRIFEEYDFLPASPPPTYVDLAGRTGLSEVEVKRRLVRVREEVAREIQAKLAGLTSNEREFRDEWNWLFGS